MADYSGWTNWETWHTALLIDNEQDLYNEKVRLMKNNATLSQFKIRLRSAETKTRKFFNDSKKDNPEGWKGNFEKVNWEEIYKNAKQEEYT